MSTGQQYPAASATPSRTAYIDRLRVLMTVLVILHHAAVTYGAPGGWYISDASPEKGTQIGLTWFVATNQSYFMGFFFFLSALFTPGAYDKKGPIRFLADRLKRLGIPLVMYSLIISPVTIWLVLKYKDEVSYSFTDFLAGFHGWINFGVLWFVAALLMFTVIYVAFRLLFTPSTGADSFPRRGKILFFAAAVGLVTYLVRIFIPIGWVLEPLGFQPAHFPQYISMYITGLVAARNNWLARITFRDNRFWSIFALVLIFLGFPSLYLVKVLTGVDLSAFSGGAGLPNLLNSLWEQLTGFSVVMALLGCFGKRNARLSPLMKNMNRASFAVYIIHPVVLVSLTLIALRWPVPQETRFLCVAPLAAGLSFLTGSLLVKLPGINRVV